MKLRAGDWIELAGTALQGVVGVGAVSGAAVAAAVGQFILALVLAVVALGVFLRLKRGRLRRKSSTTSI
jgi:hypothetical protein